MLFQTERHRGWISRENAMGWYVLLVGGMALEALLVPVVIVVAGLMAFAPKPSK